MPMSPIDRRSFLALGAGFGLSTVGAASAQEAETLDPRLTSEAVSIALRRQIFKGQLVRLRTGGRRPGILLVHDQRGANAFFRSHARRLALDGWIVLLPDLLSSQGGTPESEEEAQSALARLPAADAQQVLESFADLLAKHAECTGPIGVVGFSWGAAQALHFATSGNRAKAVVAYYTAPANAEKAVEIKVPVAFHWVDDDPRTAPLADAIEKKLIGAGKVFEIFHYAGVQSGFASEPGGRRFDAAAADRAYVRTAFFLRRHLVGGV